jgi:hypothetical protein
MRVRWRGGGRRELEVSVRKLEVNTRRLVQEKPKASIDKIHRFSLMFCIKNK